MSTLEISRVRDFSESLLFPPMAKTWRDRLLKAIDDSGRSRRDISLAAGFSDTYLGEILGRKQVDPGVTKLQRICDELDVSFTWVTTGVKITPEVERLLGVWATLSEDARDALVKQSRGGPPSSDEPSSPAAEPQGRGSRSRPASRR